MLFLPPEAFLILFFCMDSSYLSSKPQIKCLRKLLGCHTCIGLGAYRVSPTQLFYNQDLPHHLHVPWQNENGGSYRQQGNRSPLLVGCHLSLHMSDKYPTNNEISIRGCTWCRADVKYPSSHLLNLLWVCQPRHGCMLLTCTHMSPPQRCLEVCICL